MGERIARVKIQREPGYLYYVKADEQGWLCIHKAILNRGGKTKNVPDKNNQNEQT